MRVGSLDSELTFGSFLFSTEPGKVLSISGSLDVREGIKDMMNMKYDSCRGQQRGFRSSKTRTVKPL